MKASLSSKSADVNSGEPPAGNPLYLSGLATQMPSGTPVVQGRVPKYTSRLGLAHALPCLPSSLLFRLNQTTIENYPITRDSITF